MAGAAVGLDCGEMVHEFGRMILRVSLAAR